MTAPTTLGLIWPAWNSSERLKDVVATDVERVKRAPDRLGMQDGVLRDLEEQVARIYAFNRGRAGLRATEGEVIAAREARPQRPEAEHIGKILDPGQPVAEMPLVIRRDGVRVSVDDPVIARVGQAIAERK